MTELTSAIAEILRGADPRRRVMATRALRRDWRQGKVTVALHDGVPRTPLPDVPAWPDAPELMRPGAMPKRGKLGSERSRIAMLHALAHIEFVAIALALDLVGRFGSQFPPAFVDDWLGVAAEEAMHFALLERRLHAAGSFYGAMPAHAGLWSAAAATRDDVLARLAIVPMVLEARGLDVTPATITRFRAQGDETTARILSRILDDEVKHVAAGTKWFEFACDERGIESVPHWQMLVSRGFRGAVKGPFNDSARHKAGLTQEYYTAVATLTSEPQ